MVKITLHGTDNNSARSAYSLSKGSIIGGIKVGSLIKKHVSLTDYQVKFGVQKGGSLSRYIRSLIDREMGREEVLKLLNKGGESIGSKRAEP